MFNLTRRGRVVLQIPKIIQIDEEGCIAFKLRVNKEIIQLGAMVYTSYRQQMDVRHGKQFNNWGRHVAYADDAYLRKQPKRQWFLNLEVRDAAHHCSACEGGLCSHLSSSL